MNEFLWLLMLFMAFITIVLCYKFMGKSGLFLWIVIATIVSNIQACKTITLFGLDTSLGTAFYGSTFLATDILSYKYGMKESKKTILYGFLAMIIMTFFMAFALIFKPSIHDFAQHSLETIFSFNIRVTVASILGFCVSQFMDIMLFHKLQGKYDKLWLSNNISTMICQLVDTIIFSLITYYNVMDFSTVIELMFSIYIFKVIIALLDTPFIYIASKIKNVKAV